MLKKSILNINEKYLLIFFILLGVFYRFYNTNFEDYWLDEFFGFWISDPELNFSETYDRSFGPGWGQNILFDFILKYFYLIFGYYPENGRIFTATISSISIPLIAFLSYQIDKTKSYLLSTFLISHCWYLISYSQEVRSYSFGYLLSVLSIILFIYLINIDIKKIKTQFFFGLLFLIINLIGLINHIFFGIIVVSQFLFLFNYTKEKLKYKYFILNLFTLAIIYISLMYPFLVKNLSSSDFWVSHLNFKFFFDYFFPRFFGSKIMGYIYLVILLFLLFKSKKIIFASKSKYQLLIIILFSSYFFPIIYGFIKIPILIDRYIIFVITPIILLISHLIFAQSKKTKLILIFIICSTTFINNYIEIFERKNSKPEFNKVMAEISNNPQNKIEILSNSKDGHKWVTNYLNKLNYSKYENFKYYNYKSTINDQIFWSICYFPLNSFNCEKNLINTNYRKIDSKKFFLIEASLYERIKQ